MKTTTLFIVEVLYLDLEDLKQSKLLGNQKIWKSFLTNASARVEKWILHHHYTSLEQSAVYNLLARRWSLKFGRMLLVILHHMIYVLETESLSCAEDVKADHSALVVGVKPALITL